MANNAEISALASTIMPGFTITPQNRRRMAQTLWGLSRGKGFAPADPGNPLVNDLVKAGYFSRSVDHGIECLNWTEAGAEIAREPIVEIAHPGQFEPR